MRQRITPDQLQQLTPSQQEKLRAWWKPEERDSFLYENAFELCVNYSDDEFIYCFDEFSSVNKKYSYPFHSIGHTIDSLDGHPVADRGCCLPLLSIGQCIEILENSNFNGIEYHYVTIISNTLSAKKCLLNFRNKEIEADNLCDALWEAVKSIL